MKQFKLIKEYPGSLKLGSIVIENKSNFKYYFKENEKIGHCFSESYIEDNPEYWEEIEEKEWEILSWIDEKGNIYENGEPINTIAGDGKKYITSVIRLSDGEVFTIGDKVLCNEEHVEQINSITIYQENHLSFNFKHSGNCFTTECEWERMQPHKFLFTTEDGIELFGGERAYLVTDTLLKGILLSYSVEDFKNTKGKIFAKKENAEKYIRDNTKKYSLNDMVSVANHWAYIKNVTPEKILKYLENENKNR